MNARLQLRLLKPAKPRTAPELVKPGRWSPLCEPVFPDETQLRMRAQSILAGTRYRDGSTNPDTLTLERARDVLAWAFGGAPAWR